MFIVAAAVGIFVAKVREFSHAVALLLAGLAVSVLGVITDRQPTPHDVFFLVLLDASAIGPIHVLRSRREAGASA